MTARDDRSPNEVQVEAAGAGPPVRPAIDDTLGEDGGWLVVPPTGHHLTDEEVRELRDADQH